MCTYIYTYMHIKVLNLYMYTRFEHLIRYDLDCYLNDFTKTSNANTESYIVIKKLMSVKKNPT